MKIMAHRFTIKKLTKNEILRLDAAWQEKAKDFLMSDGDKPHENIAFNPLLQKAIEEIRIGYMALFNEQRQLHLLSDRLEKKPNQMEYGDKRAEILNRLHEVYVRIAKHTSASMSRLMRENYGFSEDNTNLILSMTPPEKIRQDHSQPLTEAEAKILLGGLIKHAAQAFRELGEDRIEVPRTFDPEDKMLGTVFGRNVEAVPTSWREYNQPRKTTMIS